MSISIMPPRLKLEQQAKLKLLDNRLPIKDIAKLQFINDEPLIVDRYAFLIADACLNGELNFFHGVKSFDWRWICDNPTPNFPNSFPMSFIGDGERIPIDEINDISSIFCLESDWTDYNQPPPAFKYNDTQSKHKRFYRNNCGTDSFNFLRYDYVHGGRCFVYANDFKQWLMTTKRYPLPKDCLLNNWFQETETENMGNAGAGSHVKTDDSNLTKLEKQQRAILEVIKQKGYEPLAIPDGGKSAIEIICKHDYSQYFDRDTSFNNAWKASKALFKMANHASYNKGNIS